MRKVLLLALLFVPFACLAQQPAVYIGLIIFDGGGNPIPAPSTGTDVGPLPQYYAGALCWNSGLNKWVKADSSCFGGGGGGGTPGSPANSVQFNSAGSFGGIPGSTVDGTNGLISLVPTGSGVALTLQQDASGSDALIVNANEGAGLVGGTLVDFSAQENDAAAGQVITLDLGATENNSTGNPTSVIDLDITAADSSNIGADLVSNIFATITPQAVSGVGAEFSNIILMHTADPLPDIAPLISTGIHIQDINAGSNPATTVNAGILIDDQTPGANVYAIKTGAGAVTLGGSAITLPNLPSTTKADVVGIDPSTGALTKQAAGGGGLPTIIQQGTGNNGSSNTSSYTYTFPQALKSGGATAWMLLSGDGSSAVTVPSGWTTDFNEPAASFARLVLVHKTSAGDTTAVWTVASPATFSVQFFEMEGTHTLDTSAVSASANTATPTPPSLTPAAGAMLVAGCAFVSNGDTSQTANYVQPLMGVQWSTVYAGGPDPSGGRVLAFEYLQQPTTATAIRPPVINAYNVPLFTSGGVACGTFSIL